MPKFNANLSMMFNEVGFLDRFGSVLPQEFRRLDKFTSHLNRKMSLTV